MLFRKKKVEDLVQTLPLLGKKKGDLCFVVPADTKCQFDKFVRINNPATQKDEFAMSYFIGGDRSTELVLIRPEFDFKKKLVLAEASMEELNKVYKPYAYTIKIPQVFKFK